MFTISKEQYQIFEKEAWNSFMYRVITFLREEMPNHVIIFDDAQLTHRIERATKLAEAFGLLNEYDIVCFLMAGLLLGDEQFYKNPKYSPMRSILENVHIESDDKAEQILTVAVQQLV